MSTYTTLKKIIAVVTLSVAAALPLAAQQNPDVTQPRDVEDKPQIDLPENRDAAPVTMEPDDTIKYRTEAASKQNIRKINKASQVIGMEIKNHRGELLGEIQDVVIDLPTGRVSYVVLAIGGFLGVGEKYIAVPPSAFQPGAAPDQLVLNIDKSKVEAARGFVKTQWPDLENPDWGAAADWARDPAIDRPDESSGTVRIQRDSAEADPEIRVKETDTSGYYRSSRTGAEGEQTESFRGRIVAVNPQEGILTVSGESGTRTFHLTERPVLALRGNRYAQLIDFKPGYSVAVGYHKEGDRWIAHSVIRTDPSEFK